MEIQKPASSDGNSKKATITKQNSEECRVSDLMEILDNDLFNPRYVGVLFKNIGHSLKTWYSLDCQSPRPQSSKRISTVKYKYIIYQIYIVVYMDEIDIW